MHYRSHAIRCLAMCRLVFALGAVLAAGYGSALSVLAGSVPSGQVDQGRQPATGSQTTGGVEWISSPSSAGQPAKLDAADEMARPAASLRSGAAPDGPLKGHDRVPAALARSVTAGAPMPQTGTDYGSVGTSQFQLAREPAAGGYFDQGPVQHDACATPVPPLAIDFSPTPVDCDLPHDPLAEIDVYQGKSLYANQRPLIEWGRPWYQLGQLAPAATVFGSHNPASPQFIVYGDYRMAYASNDFGEDTTSQLAFELNLNFDLRLTSTERLTAFIAPLDSGAKNTRWLLDEDRYDEELDAELEFGMFEGDLGAIVGGATGQTLPFDLPFAIGVIPLVIQNGTWMNDAVLGAAVTLPARNSPRLDISNMDITFFAAWDNIDSLAFPQDNNDARMYGTASFVEAMGGYLELDYAFIEDRDSQLDRSYHNVGMAFSRRFGRLVSNSTRVIVNAGQSSDGGPNTADGVLLLFENSLITSRPSTFVPYLNLFAGFDRPQSAARAAGTGGILFNTGILFESDGMTDYPTLDANAHDSWGGAIGLNILTDNFDQQLILELATVQTLKEPLNGNLLSDQYGAGVRYQIPLSNAWILRTDAMYGFLGDLPDVHGARLELRHKF